MKIFAKLEILLIILISLQTILSTGEYNFEFTKDSYFCKGARLSLSFIPKDSKHYINSDDTNYSHTYMPLWMKMLLTEIYSNLGVDFTKKNENDTELNEFMNISFSYINEFKEILFIQDNHYRHCTRNFDDFSTYDKFSVLYQCLNYIKFGFLNKYHPKFAKDKKDSNLDMKYMKYLENEFKKDDSSARVLYQDNLRRKEENEKIEADYNNFLENSNLNNVSEFEFSDLKNYMLIKDFQDTINYVKSHDFEDFEAVINNLNIFKENYDKLD